MSEKRDDSRLEVIVLTGGPCAGKTTALSIIPDYFEKLGWRVITIPEEATNVILSGFRLDDCSNPIVFQKLVTGGHLNRLLWYQDYVASAGLDKVLIVCDRGACDNKAYIGQNLFEQVLESLMFSEAGVHGLYGAVFHLVTAADGAEEFYTLGNNAARSEPPEQARELDLATQNAWVGHPHLRIIKNDGSFEDKMKHLLGEISSFLGEPKPYEIERKFLIDYPDIEQLRKMPNCQEVEILQTYLKSNPGEEVRVRQRGIGENYTFTKTIKQMTSDPAKRIEVERKIDEKEYLQALMQAEPYCTAIRKTRFCILQRDSGQYLEVDIYPSSHDTAILEIEIPDVDANIVFPDFLNVRFEVTGNPLYSNYGIAKNGGRLPR